MQGTAGVDDAAPTGQSYVERPPVPALTGLVSSVWIQRVSPAADPYTQRNIPNGGVELLCPVGSVPRVVGPLTRPLVEVLVPGTTVVGVRLRPGAAASVLGLPASELADLVVGTDELWAAPPSRWASGWRAPPRRTGPSPVSSSTSSAGWAVPRAQTRSSWRPCGA